MMVRCAALADIAEKRTEQTDFVVFVYLFLGIISLCMLWTEILIVCSFNPYVGIMGTQTKLAVL